MAGYVLLAVLCVPLAALVVAVLDAVADRYGRDDS